MPEENGTTPPAPADTDGPAPVPAADRAMGLFGLAVAILIGLIAVDLLTGGAVSRMLPAREATDGG